MRRTLCALIAAPVLILTTATVAAADETETPPPESEPIEIGGETVEPGADATIKISESAITDAREDAVEEEASEGLTPEEEELEDFLVDSVEDRGGTLDEDAVDVVPLLDGDIMLTVPVDVEVDSVTVDINDYEVGLSATTSETSEPQMAGAGPGFEPYWRNDGDGDYVLTVTGWGDALFTWTRDRLIDDGHINYVWYAYRRFGDAQPYDRTGYDARVTRLRVQSYPYDSIESRLLNWNEWDPATDFTGDCNGTIYAEIAVYGAVVGTTFEDCDKYEVWRNANNPGSYWIQMDQGTWIHEGDRQAGYAVAWKAERGTPGSQHDFQRVNFRLHGNSTVCDSYDWEGDETCRPD